MAGERIWRWRKLDLRDRKLCPAPGELIAVRKVAVDDKFYDLGRVKIIDGRAAYYSISDLGSVMLTDEDDMEALQWLPIMEGKR